MHWKTSGSIFLIVAVFGLISYVFENWSWFSRSGSLVVVVAIILEYWPVFIVKNANDMPHYWTQESHEAARYSAAFVCFGTVLWGFGDLFCYFFDQCSL